MPSDSFASPALFRKDLLAQRVELLQRAMEALEELIRRTPEGRALPLPLRAALSDFDRELTRIGRAGR